MTAPAYFSVRPWRSRESERPPAVMYTTGKTAYICAWHEPQPIAKNAADAWAVSVGFTPSHGICKACEKKQLSL